jgi:hypothetical protein
MLDHEGLARHAARQESRGRHAPRRSEDVCPRAGRSATFRRSISITSSRLTSFALDLRRPGRLAPHMQALCGGRKPRVRAVDLFFDDHGGLVMARW